MRARNIKPAFFDNEDLAECQPLARLLFIGLWCMADRRGRLEDRPKRIKKQLFGYDDCDVVPLLDELERHGFISRYEVAGDRYIWLPTFLRHQRPHRNEQDSTLPPHPDEASAAPVPDDVAPEDDESTTMAVPEHNHGCANDEPWHDPVRPDVLIPDTGLLTADPGLLSADAALARDGSSSEVDPSECERRIAGLVQQVRGMAGVPQPEIVLHLREIISTRETPVSEQALLADALRFRDHWNTKRSNQPAERWRGWRTAMTNWFTRTNEQPRAAPPSRAGQLSTVERSLANIRRVDSILERQEAG